MSPSEHFQTTHGPEWAGIVGSAAFTAALLLVNAETVQSVAKLTDDQIQAQGQIILADLRGRLAHENALIDLSVIHPDLTNDLPASTYPNPEDEAAEEEAAAKGESDESPGPSLRSWTEQVAPLAAESPEPKRTRTKKVKNVSV